MPTNRGGFRSLPALFILVSLQKKNAFEVAAGAAAVSAVRWKARVYAIGG